jgi:hypothetical protein
MSVCLMVTWPEKAAGGVGGMGGMHGARSIVIKYVRLLEILSLPSEGMNEEI